MQTIIGVFDRAEQARAAVSDLVDTGVDRNDISLLANDRSGSATTTTGSALGVEGDRTGYGDQKTADGTTVGENVAGGALFGGLGGLLIGLGALAIPGIGPVVAAGPLATTLAGAGFGALGGGLIGAIKDLGVPDEDAHFYAESVRRGSTLVSVRAEENLADRVSDILNRNGAIDVEDRSQQFRSSGFTQFSHDAEPYRDDDRDMSRSGSAASGNVRTGNTAVADRGATIPIVEESLEVGKRTVSTGGVRVYKHVVDKPVQEQVSLREERVTVDRRPVDRAADASTLNAFQEGTIEVTEMSEVPVVSKTARVVEEVVIGKEATQRTETVSDTVRRTQVDVEQAGGMTASRFEDYDQDFRTHFTSTYGSKGKNYDTYGTAYRYGFDAGSDARYRGRDYSSVEADLRRDYQTRNPGGAWDDVKDAVRHAYHRVTGRA